jgi:hypothetical protein
VADLAVEWLEHLEGRTTHRDRNRRYSERTVALYRQRLQQHIVPALGHLPVAEWACVTYAGSSTGWATTG